MEADGYTQDLRNCIIYTCRLVVTDVITGVGLLGLHVGKSVNPHWAV